MSDEPLIDAVRRVEESILDINYLPSALGNLAQTLSAVELCLANADSNAPTILHTPQADDMYRAYMEEGWHKSDVRTLGLVKLGPTNGRVIQEHQFVSPSARSTHPFYLDFCERFDIAWCTAWTYAHEDESWGFSLLRGRKEGQLEGEQLKALSMHTPSLIRAALLASRLRSTEINALGQGLEASGHAAFVLDHRGQCMFATRAAENNFDDDFGLKSGRLSSRSVEAQALLDNLTRQAMSPYQVQRGLTFHIVRPDRTPLLLNAVPVRRTGLDAWPGARMIGLIYDPERSYPRSLRILTELYGLTHSECRVADAIYKGLSAQAAGAEMGLKVSTVRQYLKSILFKTGLTRQSQIAALLARLPPQTD